MTNVLLKFHNSEEKWIFKVSPSNRLRGLAAFNLRIRVVLSAAFFVCPGRHHRRQKLLFIGLFGGEMSHISNKTEKNRKKPVETEENRLTKRPERLKVNCGTVLRTRMNTDDSHGKVSAALVGEMQARRADR